MQVSTPRSIVCALLQSFDAMTSQKPVTSTDSGITHPGNWPLSASYGIEYTCHDRQFPDVKHGVAACYFDELAEMLNWLKSKRSWILSTDNDFSMTYSTYVWDLGPELKSVKSL